MDDMSQPTVSAASEIERLAAEFERAWSYDDDLRRSVGMETAGRQTARRIRAILNALPPNDWLPMDTAPRDGTRVLLARRQKMSGPGLEKAVVIGSWGAARKSPHSWSLEITQNHYHAQDGDLLGWLPLPDWPDDIAY